MGLIGRVGGKTKLRKVITKMMPEHEIYVEPFIGGGSVFLEKEPAKLNIINDKDTDIINIWKDVRELPIDIYDNMKFVANRELFKKYANQKTFNSKRDRLYRNLYLSKVSYSGKRNSYGGDNQKIGTGKKYINLAKQIKETPNLKIFNKDFKTIIKKYDSPKTLFYLDPPYDIESQKGDWGYTHERLPIEDVYNAVKNIKGKFILSYNKSKKIKDLFKDFNIKNVSTSYQLGDGSNREKLQEVVIKNF